MFAQTVQAPSAYVSLNTSHVGSPVHAHMRTQSYSKMPPASNHVHTHVRTPSQKKLTLTVQNLPIGHPSFKREGEGKLKKRGPVFMENNSHFLSMGSSRVYEEQTTFTKAEHDNTYLKELKQKFEGRLKQLQGAYFQSINESAGQIRELQRQLLSNSRQLQSKGNKLRELQTLCKQYQSKMNVSSENSSKTMIKRIKDIECRLRVVADSCQELSTDQSGKVDHLTTKVVAHFGYKLEHIKYRSSQLVDAGAARIMELESELSQARCKEQHSEGTRGSLGSQLSIGRTVQDQCGMSFMDDCFFYPAEHSQNYELIVEMTKRREIPLQCWIDEGGYIRYTDTHSYIFNRKGDRIALPRQELELLISQRLMIIF